MNPTFKYVYGPIESWRMGKSLGIDPLSDARKICNMDCIYCQLGESPLLTDERKDYVSTSQIIKEVNAFFAFAALENPSLIKDIDYITFSGRGEPTLASNLGEMIIELRRIRREKIAVITNGTLLNNKDVERALWLANLVVVKLDACNQQTFESIDKPRAGTSIREMIEALKAFREGYPRKLAVQIMLVEQNKHCASEIASMLRTIDVDEVQINTPLRPSGVKALTEKEIEEASLCFAGLPVSTVYDKALKETRPLDKVATIKRHGNYVGTARRSYA